MSDSFLAVAALVEVPASVGDKRHTSSMYPPAGLRKGDGYPIPSPDLGQVGSRLQPEMLVTIVTPGSNLRRSPTTWSAEDDGEQPVSGATSARRIEVDPERVVLWANGFAERHGAPAWSSTERSVALSAPDGATAVLEPFVPGTPGRPSVVEELAGWAVPPIHLALILVRRGGYAVGLGLGAELVAHKVGTRYVQSRTAAGGWSQQRFARRRVNQADALVGSVIEHTRRIVLVSPNDALVVGGDKALVRDVLADPRLARVAQLPRRELFDLPDPKLVVLRQALRRGRAVRITLSEPSEGVGEQ